MLAETDTTQKPTVALSKSEAARLNGKKGGRPRKGLTAAAPAASTPKPTKPTRAAKPTEPEKPTDRKRSPTRVRVSTLKAQALFLREFALCGNVSRACLAAAIGRSTLYGDWLKAAAFHELYLQAVDDAADLLEEEARRRAVDGVEKPVFQGGREVGVIREYSDALLTLLLKGKRPETYRERYQHEHSGPGGTPIQVITNVPQPDGAHA